MGQYGNQPDFGTSARKIIPTGGADNVDSGQRLAPGMLYIGASGDLVATVVGGNEDGVNNTTLFKNVPIGIFPVIVTNVWAENGSGASTTVDNIVILY
jgi:hypothetical protein